MTFNTDIEKTEKEIAVLQKKLDLLKEIEAHKSQPRMTLENEGNFEIVSYNKKSYYRFEFPDEVYWYRRTSHETYLDLKLERITDGETHRLLEGVWFNEIRKGRYTDEPEYYDEVVNRLVEERKSKKLRNMLKVQLDYDVMVCDDIVDIVEDWILEEQNASGSQNVDTELLVEGFNDAIRKMKEMLR